MLQFIDEIIVVVKNYKTFIILLQPYTLIKFWFGRFEVLPSSIIFQSV